jgi:hypothetical protein
VVLCPAASQDLCQSGTLRASLEPPAGAFFHFYCTRSGNSATRAAFSVHAERNHCHDTLGYRASTISVEALSFLFSGARRRDNEAVIALRLALQLERVLCSPR